jgi:hypothetical protein
MRKKTAGMRPTKWPVMISFGAGLLANTAADIREKWILTRFSANL